MILVKNKDVKMRGDIKVLTAEIASLVLLIAEDLADELGVTQKTAVNGIVTLVLERIKKDKKDGNE